MMRFALFVSLAVLLLSACDGGKSETNQVAGGNTVTTEFEDVPADEQPGSMEDATLAESPVTDQWIGRWDGVGGQSLDISKGQTAGAYRITITGASGTTTVDGIAAGETIAFKRGEAKETLRLSTSAATGETELAEKASCLMIKPGESYCRGE